MRPIIQEDKAAPLSLDEKNKLIAEHLPYRIEHLRDAILRVPAKTLADNQAFEAGAVAGRVMLEFLGVGYDSKKDLVCESRAYSRTTNGLTDDVKVVDIGGEYVAISDLSSEEQKTLAKFIRGVHKACAHLTVGSEHELDVEIFRNAARLIIRLYEGHVPKV